MEFIYRKLVEADADAYWALRVEAVEREPRSFGVTPEEHRRTTLDETRAMIAQPGGFCVGAFDGESLVGFVWLQREPGVKEWHKAHVRRVYVTASYRGRGVARSMLGALIEWARQDASCEQLLLAVGVFNVGARKVYEAMGFVGYGIEPRALRHGDEYGYEYIDEEHMILRP